MCSRQRRVLTTHKILHNQDREKRKKKKRKNKKRLPRAVSRPDRPINTVSKTPHAFKRRSRASLANCSGAVKGPDETQELIHQTILMLCELIFMVARADMLAPARPARLLGYRRAINMTTCPWKPDSNPSNLSADRARRGFSTGQSGLWLRLPSSAYAENAVAPARRSGSPYFVNLCLHVFCVHRFVLYIPLAIA